MVKVESIQNRAKEVMKYIDLYGNVVMFSVLKQYPFVSWCDKSIPKEGSPTRLAKDICMKKANELKILKLIAHRDFKTTIVTDKGVFQFFASGMQNKK
jgi:hypothetical protein